MRIPNIIIINDEKIRALIQSELKKHDFEKLDEINKRLDKIEETLKFYIEHLKKERDKPFKEWWGKNR
jgi:hypothetical protein